MRLLIVLILITAATGLAQPSPGFFPWWDSPIVRDLNLSEDQTRQIRAAVTEFRDRMIDQRAAVEKAEAAMQDVMNEDPFDARRAEQVVDKLVAARAELTRSFSQMSVRLRAVLTTQQWRELQRRWPQMRRPEARPTPQGTHGRPGWRRPGSPPRPGQPLKPQEPPRPPAAPAPQL